MNPRIIVSAVCVFDAAGRLLTVRKRGTDKFMHPGGKPEPGETAVAGRRPGARRRKWGSLLSPAT